MPFKGKDLPDINVRCIQGSPSFEKNTYQTRQGNILAIIVYI